MPPESRPQLLRNNTMSTGLPDVIMSGPGERRPSPGRFVWPRWLGSRYAQIASPRHHLVEASDPRDAWRAVSPGHVRATKSLIVGTGPGMRPPRVGPENSAVLGESTLT